MELKNQNILFFSRSTQHGGTENIVLQLCEVIKPYVNKIVVMAADGFNIVPLERMGIKFYSIPDIEKKDLSTIIVVRKRLQSVVRKEQISIIHTHHRMAAFYCQIINNRGLTLINTLHNDFYDKRILTQFALRNMNLIACGKNVKKSLIDYQKIDAKRVTVITNSIKPFNGEIDKIPIIEKIKKEGYIVAGVIGRLSKEKGVINLVEVVKKLSDHRIRFIIVGTGDEENNIKRKIREYGLENRFIFLGYRTDAQNIAIQLDYLIIPSLKEGLPLVPIEAFSVGRTVIGTDVGGTAEIIDDGVNGLLVPPQNDIDLRRAIESMTRERIRAFGENAYQKYIRCFSYDVFQEAYLNYYKGLK